VEFCPKVPQTVRRILAIPKDYLEVIPIGTNLFKPLYQFENGLRIAIDKHLSTCYGPDWWEKKLQFDLPTVYRYAEDVKQKHNRMPWIGDSSRVTIRPIHNVTLGHLEEIVKMYQSECIPSLFHNIQFFLGHMDAIKLVRNLYGHMFPCLTHSDARTAKREITTLCEELKSKV
jgi:hypothetical protein